MVGRLRLPDLVEFSLVHCAVWIEILTFSGADWLALLVPTCEKLPERPRTALFDAGAQRAYLRARLLRLALVLVTRRLPVRLEASPLIEMEYGAPQLMRFESVVERTRSDRVGIELFERLAFVSVLRHEAELDERAHEIVSALQVTVTATTLAARDTALDGI